MKNGTLGDGAQLTVTALSSCSCVTLFIWHCVGGFPVWGVVLWARGWGIGEGRGGGWGGGVRGCVCIHQPTPSLWSMKESPQKTAAARHSDKTLQIVPLIKNLSCRNTIDSKRGRENKQPGPCTPSYALRHTQTRPLFLSPPPVPKLHPKTMHTTHQFKDGRRLWGDVCV